MIPFIHIKDSPGNPFNHLIVSMQEIIGKRPICIKQNRAFYILPFYIEIIDKRL